MADRVLNFAEFQDHFDDKKGETAGNTQKDVDLMANAADEFAQPTLDGFKEIDTTEAQPAPKTEEPTEKPEAKEKEIAAPIEEPTEEPTEETPVEEPVEEPAKAEGPPTEEAQSDEKSEQPAKEEEPDDVNLSELDDEKYDE